MAKDRAAARARIRVVVAALRPWFLTVVFFGVGYLLAVWLHYDPRSPLVSVGLQVAAGALAALCAVLAIVSMLRVPWVMDAVAAATSAFTGLVLAVALHGSTYAVGGIGIAAANRTPAVVRYSETWHLVDYSYKGLPAFYPPLMPWVAGRFAALAGITPWLALKLVSIALLALAPLAAYLLWRRILPAHLALFAPVAMLALVTLAPSMLQQPDSLVSLAVIVPWWVEAVYGVRRSPYRAWPFWVSGLVGAAVFCLYYYYFFPLAIALLLTPLLDRVHPPSFTHRYRQRLLVVGSAAAISAVYWLPFLVSVARSQRPASLQNLWFTPDMTALHLDFLDPTVAGVLMLAGLVHLLVTWRADRVSMALLLLVAAGYLWYALAAVGDLVGLPVLGFRTVPFIDMVLLIAAIRSVAALVALGAAALARTDKASTGSTALAAPVVLAALAFLAGQQYTTTTLGYSHVRQSHDTPLPNGRLQPYADPQAHRPHVSERRLEAAVRQRFSGSGEPVVLSSRSDLLKLSGMYAFNQWNAIYAHPAGEFYARVRLLRNLASTGDPAAFARLARGNRFDPIDAFVLVGRKNRLDFSYSDVSYPNGAKERKVHFARAQFSPSYWRTTQLGPYFVAVAR